MHHGGAILHFPECSIIVSFFYIDSISLLCTFLPNLGDARFYLNEISNTQHPSVCTKLCHVCSTNAQHLNSTWQVIPREIDASLVVDRSYQVSGSKTASPLQLWC